MFNADSVACKLGAVCHAPRLNHLAGLPIFPVLPEHVVKAIVMQLDAQS